MMIKVGRVLARNPLNYSGAINAIKDVKILKRITNKVLDKFNGVGRHYGCSLMRNIAYREVIIALADNIHSDEDILRNLYTIIKPYFWYYWSGGQQFLNGETTSIIALFKILKHRNCPREILSDILFSSAPVRLRECAAMSRNATAKMLHDALGYNMSIHVRAKIARNPRVSEMTLLHLSNSQSMCVLGAVAKSSKITDLVARKLLTRQYNGYVNVKTITKLLLENPRLSSSIRDDLIRTAKEYINTLCPNFILYNSMRDLGNIMGVVSSKYFTYEDLQMLILKLEEVDPYVAQRFIGAILENPYVDENLLVELTLAVGAEMMKEYLPFENKLKMMKEYKNKYVNYSRRQRLPSGIDKQALYELGSNFVENPFSFEEYIPFVTEHKILRIWINKLANHTGLYGSIPLLYTTPFVLKLFSNRELPKALGNKALPLLSNALDMCKRYMYKKDYLQVLTVILMNENIPSSLLRKALEDTDDSIRRTAYKAIAANPGISKELCTELAESVSPCVRLALAFNPSTPESVLKKLVKSRNRSIHEVAALRLAS